LAYAQSRLESLDIKPQNILIDYKGIPKLSDYASQSNSKSRPWG